jgi:hypothetical protein
MGNIIFINMSTSILVINLLSLRRSDATSKYVQLATVREDNTPACRTIVFRGFLPDSNALYFVTVYCVLGYDGLTPALGHASHETASLHISTLERWWWRRRRR